MPTVKTAELRYVGNGHNKFWRYYTLDRVHWIAHNGRIGTRGQYHLMLTRDVDPDSRWSEKLAEGYRTCIPGFEFTITDSELADFKQRLNVAKLGSYFDHHNPGPLSGARPTSLSKSISTSKIAADLDKLLKLNES